MPDIPKAKTTDAEGILAAHENTAGLGDLDAFAAQRWRAVYALLEKAAARAFSEIAESTTPATVRPDRPRSSRLDTRPNV